MKNEELNKAIKIKSEIERLNEEICMLPRDIINMREYKENGCMYVKRCLYSLKRKLFKNNSRKGNLIFGIKYGDFESYRLLELSEEDLQALVDIRERKVDKLREELENL